ncbi:hypothetical protein KFL_007370050 [Klebsormidium nitens]|uniref:Uncharacterized protein n=1 Tax=Klebsormidium nitens TaxID=105231 RepID=A0A1Y1IJX7_KLENI|nr:hypothetical protein KFL_007370050 [Klebsormidium nitens]|eukprot:GAQ91165.1 hypothetical protein KFL_007370050 [Klebsormidium nitens]
MQAACGANCIAVINPNSGPGKNLTEAQDFGRTSSPCITKLRAKGYAASPGGADNDKRYYQQVAGLVTGTRVLNAGGRFEPSMTDIFDLVVGFEETGKQLAGSANYHGMCPIPTFPSAHSDDSFCTGIYPGTKPYLPNAAQNDTNKCSTCGAKIASLTAAIWTHFLFRLRGRRVAPGLAVDGKACLQKHTGGAVSPCITKLRARGVKVLGYIATTHTGKPVSAVQAEYQLYARNFPVLDGVFFDEGTTWYNPGPGGADYDKSYYEDVAALVTGTRVLNPGGRFEASMTDLFEIVVGFEQTAGNWVANAIYHGMSAAPSRILIPGLFRCPIPFFTTAHTDVIFCTGAYPGAKPYVPNPNQNDTNTCSPCRAKIAAMVCQSTNVTNYVSIVNQCAAAGYDYCYVTNDGADGNPWDSLPSYFSCYAT